MHGAPSVSYPVGRSRIAGLALLVAWIIGVAGLLAWRSQVQAPPLATLLAVAAVLVPGAMALRAWMRSPSGTLAWDGKEWTWAEPASTEAGAPEPVLDFQRWMLLRWRGSACTRWLWLERDMRRPAWASLRRAVYSRARTAAGRTAPEGEARP